MPEQAAPLTDSAERARWAGIVRSAARPLALVVLLHVVAFGILFAVVIPGHYEVNGRVFGIGLAITAYLLGVRHAFDADHIAAIDNTTRKLVGRRETAGHGRPVLLPRPLAPWSS